jgi:beta-carotene 3-hydroxylase
MHGPLWFLHQTHHIHTSGYWENNDVFTIIFGTMAVILIFSGLPDLSFYFWLGVGMSIYGLTYFIVHDVFIHKRINIGNRPKSGLFKAVTRAHQDHHKTKNKKGSISFGLFMIPVHYYKKFLTR